MSSFCWSFLPTVGRSQARVKYSTKHDVRDEGDACFSDSLLPSFFFKYATPRLHCGACHANVKPKFTKEAASSKFFENSHASRATWKNVQRRTNASKSTLLRTRKDGGSFRDIDGAWRDHSFSVGDVSAPRRTENRLYCFFCLFILIKLLKEKQEKGSVGFVASSGVRLQPCRVDRRQRCMFVTDRFSGV